MCDVLAGSTVPMDRESQLQILEKMLPVLQSAGVQPGSPAAKAYAREMTRLAGLMSMETVMDIADQQLASTASEDARNSGQGSGETTGNGYETKGKTGRGAN